MITVLQLVLPSQSLKDELGSPGRCNDIPEFLQRACVLPENRAPPVERVMKSWRLMTDRSMFAGWNATSLRHRIRLLGIEPCEIAARDRINLCVLLAGHRIHVQESTPGLELQCRLRDENQEWPSASW